MRHPGLAWSAVTGTWLLLLQLLLSLTTTTAHPHGEDENPTFVGREHWPQDYIDKCNLRFIYQNGIFHEESERLCHRYRIYLYAVNVEVLSTEPILLVLHEFATRTAVQAFEHDAVTKKALEEQKVVNERETDGQHLHTSRRANGTWFFHWETPAIAQMSRRVRTLVPNINFDGAEQWQVLSYNPNGHYAPHYDYLDYSSEKHWDHWMRDYGNRFATFLLVLKTASSGGGTVFPSLEQTVVPKAGDVMLWLNMDVNGQKALRSLHGACPITGGNKVAATLWVRQRGQELGVPCINPVAFDLEALIRPRPRVRNVEYFKPL